MQIHEFHGQRITADHADYDTARAVWNGAIDRHPRLIARCSGAADVAAAARYLGWKAKTPLADGLRQTVEWYRRQHDAAGSLKGNNR